MKILKLLPVGTLLGMLCINPPAGIEIYPWKVFALFFSTILALVLKSAAMGAVGLISLTVGPLLGIFKLNDALLAFSAPVVWQIAVIFFIARGFVKTGLAKRIAFHIVKFFGKSVLGLGYGFVLTNFIMGPLIPSCAARVGGILFPIVRSISEILGSDPEHGTQKKIGSFFTLLTLYGNALVASTFLTAMAGNLIIKAIAAESFATITWLSWFINASVPSLVCLITMPLILFHIYPPEITDISKTRELIQSELKKLGKLKKQEIQMLLVLSGILFAWIFGDWLKIDSVWVSFAGTCVLILLKILDFDKDILTEKEAWNTLIWLSSLLMIAKLLTTSGFLNVLVNNIDTLINGFSWYIGLLILMIIYGYTHYLFASNTSHVSAMYAVFVGAAIKTGTPVMLATLIFAFLSSLCGGLYYYTSTEAVILYNSKYVSMKDFFKYGLIMTTTMLVIWMSVGSVWWKITGIY